MTDAWDENEEKALLDRRMSMEYAGNQLEALEAKYSGNKEDRAYKERVLVKLIKRTVDEDDEDAQSTIFSDNMVVNIFLAAVNQTDPKPVTIVVVQSEPDIAKNPKTMPPGQTDGSKLIDDSKARINTYLLKEAVPLISQLEKELGTSQESVSIFTGHGLGGAVATVLAWYWSQPTELVTFGSPKCGDRDFAFETLDNVKISSRYVFHNDPVPFFIPQPKGGFMQVLACGGERQEKYRHVGHEQHLWQNDIGYHREIVRKREPPEDCSLKGSAKYNKLKYYAEHFQNSIIDHKKK